MGTIALEKSFRLTYTHQKSHVTVPSKKDPCLTLPDNVHRMEVVGLVIEAAKAAALLKFVSKLPPPIPLLN